MATQIRLVPPFTTPNEEFLNLVSRSGFGFVEVTKLYQLWPHLNDGSVLIVSIDIASMAVLQRHMDTLLEHAPTVVTGLAGAYYAPEWNMLTAHLVAEPYATLEAQMLKSGFKSVSTDQAVARGNQVMAAPAVATAAASRQEVRPGGGPLSRGSSLRAPAQAGAQPMPREGAVDFDDDFPE